MIYLSVLLSRVEISSATLEFESATSSCETLLEQGEKNGKRSPTFSGSMTLHIGGRKCVCYNDEQWKKVRDHADVDDTFLRAFRFDSLMKEHGGKGGTRLSNYKTNDRGYVVKELKPCDHLQLLNMTPDLVAYFLKGDTLIARVFGHFKTELRGKMRNLVVMENVLNWRGEWTAAFDLKGCDDDKSLIQDDFAVPVERKRVWHLHKWGGRCFWTAKRTRYWEGKHIARNIRLGVSPSHLGIAFAASLMAMFSLVFR